jgi:hypothetical protein
MNSLRVVLAALGAFVAYFIVGGVAFGLFPSLKKEFLKYPVVYRNQQGQMSHMPLGMAAMFLGMVALAVIYSMLYQGSTDIAERVRLGASFGALIGVFAIGAFVVHNYVNLNIGPKLTIQQAVAYFVEWLIVGIVIGLIYRPITSH